MSEPFEHPHASEHANVAVASWTTGNGLSPHDLSTMLAHEFRGPVHALQAYLSVLLRERAGPLTDVQRDFLVSMQSLTSRLDRLTNDMQVMMASGKSFSIVPDEVDLLSLIDDCRWELDPIAQGLGIGIEITTFGDRSWQLWADAIRLKQIILNLLENAIRYGSVGSTVAVRLRQSRAWVLFVVENDIAQQQHQVPAEWLQPFVRGEPANDVHPRGLGVGLAIVRDLVDAHHGHLITRVRNRSIAFGVRLPRG